jgi:hypothetical protein
MLEKEPTLSSLEDYDGKESKEKRRIIWIVIFSGLAIGAVYALLNAQSVVSDALPVKTDIRKY